MNFFQLLILQAAKQTKSEAVVDPELPVPVINLSQPNDMALGDPDQALVFSSTNTGVPVVVTTSNTALATIIDGALHPIAEGEFSVIASQASGAGHAAALPVTWTVKVTAVDYTVTELSGTLQTFDGNPDLYYDSANPTRFVAVDFYRPFLIGNAANTGLFRAEQVRVNFNGSGKNVFELTRISATGDRPSGGNAASGITYTAFKSNDLRPNKGGNLTKLTPDNDNYVFDIDSNSTKDELFGALIEVGSSYSGRTDTYDYYPSDIQSRGAVNIFNLEGFPYNTPAPLPANLYGGRWRIKVPLQISYATVYPDYTRTIRMKVFGDSNTEFAGNAMLSALQRSYPSATIFFENKGKAGSRSDQWQPGSQLLNDLIAACNTDATEFLSVNLGTNDINTGISKAAYVTYMRNIADEMFAKVATIKHFYIQGIFSEPQKPAVDEYNTLIASIGHGYEQGTFDTLPFLRANPWQMSYDAIHLRPAGYMVNNHNILKVMQPAINVL